MTQCEQKGKIKRALTQLHFSSKFIFVPPVWGRGPQRFAEWSLLPKGLDRTETASKQTPCLGAAAGNYHTPFSFVWLTRWPDSRLLAGETREDDGERRGRTKRPATSVRRRLARGYGGEKPGKDARAPWTAARSCHGCRLGSSAPNPAGGMPSLPSLAQKAAPRQDKALGRSEHPLRALFSTASPPTARWLFWHPRAVPPALWSFKGRDGTLYLPTAGSSTVAVSWLRALCCHKRQCTRVAEGASSLWHPGSAQESGKQRLGETETPL